MGNNINYIYTCESENFASLFQGAKIDVRKGNWASIIAKPIPEGLGTTWDGSRPQNPLPNIEKYLF